MTSRTILIVDDLPINLKVLRAQLEGEGHTVVEARNGVEALELLDRQDVDLIVSDILMPVMDGYRLCHEVRRSERRRHLPFIVYTSTYVSPSDEKLSLDLGADRYLRKPASIVDLRRTIDEAFANPGRQPTAAFDETDVLKEYSAGLVTKLEKKNVELMDAVGKLALQSIALETAGEAVLITDAEGVILWVNPAFAKITGYTAEEVIGKTPRILKSGKHTDAFYRAFWKTIRSGETWQSEFINRHKEGELFYGQHTVTPVRDATGTITHFVGIMHDMTKRRRAEEQLRDAHEQLRELLEHSPAVLYALTLEGDAIVPRLISENVRRMLGVPAEEALSFGSWSNFGWWSEHLHPDDVAVADASLMETLANGVSRTEYRLRHRDGSYRWVDDSRRLVRDAKGNPAELVGVWSDITERRHAQDELHESERQFREMLDNLDLASVMVDRDARFTYCNDYFLRLTGWQREEMIGGNWFDFVPPERVDEARQRFVVLLEGELPHTTNEILTRSGQRRLMQWNNSVMYSPSGEVIGIASIAEDVTDRVRLEKQLLRAQRLESLGTLAGGIAHDLNNLLLPILMGVTLLKRFDPNEPSRKAIENIERSVKRGSELVKQVLLFARGGETTRASVQIEEIVREVEAIILSTFPKDIRIEVSLAPDLRPLNGDATQLSQVLLNLCVNARDAMPRGGHLLISATNDGSGGMNQLLHNGGPHVVLEVTDSGEGMPKEIIDRIFDPFYTTKEIGKGTGLGLSTAQGIIASHGGFISVSSTVGEGSTFTVYLPAQVAEPVAVPVAEDAALRHGNGEWILVVDDDASVAEITSQTLDAFGYQVLTAEDGAQAIGVFSHRAADIALVLTDMAMPVIDGAALIAALNRMDPGVRIIATTGNESAASIAKIARTGVAHILIKPYTAEQLLRTVAEALGKDQTVMDDTATCAQRGGVRPASG